MPSCIRAYRPGKDDRFAIVHDEDGATLITNGHWIVCDRGPKPDGVRRLIRRIRAIGAERDLEVDGDCGIGMETPPTVESIGKILPIWWQGPPPRDIPSSFEIIRSGKTVVAVLEAERAGAVGLHVRLDYLALFEELGASGYTWIRPRPGEPAAAAWFVGGTWLSEPIGILMPTRV